MKKPIRIMSLTPNFRSFGLAVLILSTAVLVRGESFEEPIYIDFNARGYSTYNVSMAASISSQQFNSIATAQVSFAGIFLQASGYNSAGVSLNFTGIHRLNDHEWIADSVETYESSDWWQNYQVYYDVVVPSASGAWGDGRCDGAIIPFWGNVIGWDF